MRGLNVSFFVFIIVSVLSVSGYADLSSSQLPKSSDKNGSKKLQGFSLQSAHASKPRVELKGEIDSFKKKSAVSVKGFEGKDVTAKNNYDGTWTVSGGKSTDGIIKLDAKEGIVTYQSSASKAPVYGMTLDSNGTSSISTINAVGSQKLVVIDAAGDLIQVDVTNSPRNKISAKSISEGLWEVSGTSSSGKSVKGTLEIDSETGFMAYKGSNGTFTCKKPIPIESIIEGMSTFKGAFTNESLVKMTSDTGWSKLSDEVVNVLTDLIKQVKVSSQ